MADVGRSDQCKVLMGRVGYSSIVHNPQSQFYPDPLAMDKKEYPVLDPFCGSGEFLKDTTIRLI
jgi:hypothetical protein